MEKDNYREYMTECIHLKACRRLCKMKNIHNRGCNVNCSAFEIKEKKQELFDPYGWDWWYFG